MKPDIQFTVANHKNSFDPQTGERVGEYKVLGNSCEHYISYQKTRNKDSSS